LVVHTRSASADTLALLRDEGQGAVRGVFHCFTETQAVADAALAMGFYISFSGILTFRNAQELRDVARAVPLDRCLIETDSPYWRRCRTAARPTSRRGWPMLRPASRPSRAWTWQSRPATSENFDNLFFSPSHGPSPRPY
jgi:TatD DNase family protein